MSGRVHEAGAIAAPGRERLDAARGLDDATAALPRCLDLGCGTNKLPGAVGMDADPRSHADIVHDLDSIPWPIERDSFEYVRAHDVLSRVADLDRSMEELHRVCRHGAVVHVRMPFPGIGGAADASRSRAATRRSFDHLDPRKPSGRHRVPGAGFEVMAVHYARGESREVGPALRLLDRVVLSFFEEHAPRYERYLPLVYPTRSIYYELRVIKG